MLRGMIDMDWTILYAVTAAAAIVLVVMSLGWALNADTGHSYRGVCSIR